MRELFARSRAASGRPRLGPRDPRGRRNHPGRRGKGAAPGEADRAFVLPANAHVAELTLPADVDSARPYTLAELIDIAQSHNPLTQVAWNAARDAALAVGVVWSTYLPRLTAAVVGGYNGLRSDRERTPRVRRRHRERDQQQQRFVGRGHLDAGLQWLLFDFGERAAQVGAAKQLAVASNVTFTAVHQQIAYAVTVAFYKHAAATQRVSMVEKALANAKDVQAAAELRLQQGENTAVDVAQARQATAQAEVRSVQARGAAQDSYYELTGGDGDLSHDAAPRRGRLGAGDAGERDGDDGIDDQGSRLAPTRRSRCLREREGRRGGRGRDEGVVLPEGLRVRQRGLHGGLAQRHRRSRRSDRSSPTVNLTSSGFSGTIIGGVVIPIYDGGVRGALHKQSKNRLESANAMLTARMRAVRPGDRRGGQRAAHESLGARGGPRPGPRRRDHVRRRADLLSQRGGIRDGRHPLESNLLDARIAEVDAYSGVQIAAATLAFATGSMGKAP